MTNLILGIAIAFGIMGVDGWNAHVNKELEDNTICGSFWGECREVDQIYAKEFSVNEEVSEPAPTPTPIIHDLGTPVGYIRHVFGNKSDVALAIVDCESKFNPNALFCGNDNGSCDRGLWQFSDYWHPEVSDAEAFNWELATDHAWRVSKQGTDFSPWVCYNRYIK
jgi:hypothetical protein